MTRFLAVCAFTFALQAAAADLQPVQDAGPYVPSPQSVVADMLRYAGVGPQDFIIDLGSGDGRIVRTAAKIFGARGFGVEIKDDLVKQSNEAAEQEGIADRVKFLKQDLFKTDLSPASVVTMYLLPDTVNLLKDKFLAELKPGTRIVSHDYPLTGWLADGYWQMDLEDKVHVTGVTTTLIYLYVVPAAVAGEWRARMPPALSRKSATLSLKQQLTRLSGSARLDGRDFPLLEGRVRGERISFRLAGRDEAFTGLVKGKRIEGMIESEGSRSPWSASLGG